jgi:hypothetical protein
LGSERVLPNYGNFLTTKRIGESENNIQMNKSKSENKYSAPSNSLTSSVKTKSKRPAKLNLEEAKQVQ